MKPVLTKKVVCILLVAFIATAALIKWVSTVGEEPLLKNRPDVAHAFQDLYGAPSPVTKFTPDKKHIATVWFEQELHDGANDVYVVFSKKQELDERGEIISCHACQATIDAITYVRRQGGWAKEAAIKNVAELGAYGDAPKISTAKVLLLSSGNVILTIPASYGGQGSTYQGEHLLNHFQGQWSAVGYLDIAGDNFGTSCKRKGEPPSSDPSYDSPCYSYKSTYKLATGDSLTYPNIIVSRRGQDFSTETGKVETVGDDTYVFDGEQYFSTKQKRENERLAEVQKKSSLPLSLPEKPKLSKEQAEQATDGMTRKLSYCILPAAQYGQYSSYDGGKSASNILLEKCSTETIAWVDNCMATGSSKEQCMTSVMIMTQVAIKSFGK